VWNVTIRWLEIGAVVLGFMMLTTAVSLADGPAPPGTGWTEGNVINVNQNPRCCAASKNSCFGTGGCEPAFGGKPECQCGPLPGAALKRQGWRRVGTECQVVGQPDSWRCTTYAGGSCSWWHSYSDAGCTIILCTKSADYLNEACFEGKSPTCD
jgi:hypothetical protein